MGPSFLELKTSSGLGNEELNSAKALGQQELLDLGKDDEPGGVAAAFTGQNHATTDLQCLTFLNQHFAFAKQADRNFSIL